MDINQQEYFIRKQNEKERIDKILFKLNIAEAFNFAYTGSQADKTGNCSRSYKDWRDSLINDLMPVDERAKQATFWEKNDQVKKKTGKRSFKIF